MARAGLQESCQVVMMWLLRSGRRLSLLCLMRSAVNSAMCTILVAAAFLNTVPVMGETGTSMLGGVGPL